MLLQRGTRDKQICIVIQLAVSFLLASVDGVWISTNRACDTSTMDKNGSQLGAFPVRLSGNPDFSSVLTTTTDPVIYRALLGQEQVLEVLQAIQTCTWSPSRCFNAVDCSLPMTNVTRTVAQELLKLVIPAHCEQINGLQNLPVRRFPPGAWEEIHIDSGPSWTVLLHLSHGATVFHPQGGGNVEVHHAPGDTIVWLNSGSGPLHSWRSSATSEKLVINFGVEVSSSEALAKCSGIALTAAGCAGPELIYISRFLCCCAGLCFFGILFGIGAAVGQTNGHSVIGGGCIGMASGAGLVGVCAFLSLCMHAMQNFRAQSKPPKLIRQVSKGLDVLDISKEQHQALDEDASTDNDTQERSEAGP